MTYSEYKDSGVDWIGEIPVEWEVKKLKFTGWLYGGLTGKSAKDFGNDEHDNNQPYIPFTNIADNRTISMEHFDLVVIEEDENQNRVLKNDILFLMSSEGWEDLGKASILVDDVEELYLNSFCKGFRITDENVISTFVNYQLSGNVFKELLSLGGNGFTRINLRQTKVKNLCLLLPPLQEQRDIVDYLDHKTQQIGSLIEKTNEKIEVLKEQRTATINQVVTKGLDPDAEMIDSEVDWIGEIPVGWEVKKLKFGLSHISEKEETAEGDIKISPENMESDTGKCFDLYADYSGDGMRFESGDVLFNKLRIYLKKVLFAESKGFSMGEMIVLRTNELLSNRFLYYMLFNQGLIDFLHSQSTGIKVPRVDPWTILETLTPYPEISEQIELVEFIDHKIQQIDSQVERELQRIELLKEYRNSIISEVVTGQIDVRGELVA
jgi:type I restriction enzyme, S subunit